MSSVLTIPNIIRLLASSAMSGVVVWMWRHAMLTFAPDGIYQQTAEKSKLSIGLENVASRMRIIVGTEEVSEFKTRLKEFSLRPSLASRNAILNLLVSWYLKRSDSGDTYVHALDRLVEKTDAWTLQLLQEEDREQEHLSVPRPYYANRWTDKSVFY